jgi:hypothetical protein
VTIFLFASVAKYVMFWVTEVALITTTLRKSWENIQLFMLLAVMVLIGFMVFYHIVLGPYMI